MIYRLIHEILKKSFFFCFSFCVSMCICEPECSANRGQKRSPDPLNLELQEVVSCPAWSTSQPRICFSFYFNFVFSR